MEKRTVYFATFWRPGSFFGESWTRDLSSLDPNAVEWPDEAYAFSLHKRQDVVDGDEVFRGKAKQVGGLYYHPDSAVETLAQAKKNPKATKTLIQNMEGNKWTHIAWTRWGTWPQAFDLKEDVVLQVVAMKGGDDE